MKLKYDNYLLDKTVPQYLASTLASLVVHGLNEEGRLSVTNTLVRSVTLADSQISVCFGDGTEKTIILGKSAPYWSEDEVKPTFGYPQIEPSEILTHILFDVVDILYTED